ncbi:hypothetical protein GA0074692_3191 [Micromonospora pallida]|uniref:Uncharacterized protein n=1 Tax=Micromonospora pallida TaxID=145854 RepID=A0A1C6SQN0_9ACTN|nr:hypothetical protein GA0074692_3191 [Micromonospora pallida]
MLLACTVFGLAAMHSLGHDPVMPLTADAGHTAHVAMPAPADLHHDDCVGNGCVQLLNAPAGHDGHLPGWAVCLAVVGALTLAVLLGLLLTAGVTLTLPGLPPASGIAGSRGPPARPFGLHLASVSVQRR